MERQFSAEALNANSRPRADRHDRLPILSKAVARTSMNECGHGMAAILFDWARWDTSLICED